MQKIESSEKIKVLDGNELIAQVIDEENSPFVEHCVDQISQMPEIDSDRLSHIMELKEKVEKNEYDFDSNLDKVAEKIFSESTDANPLAFPVFD